MSTINAKKSNISKYIKGTGGILKDVVGEYFQTVMPNSSDIFSDAKKEASKAVSALANTPQKVSSSVKELRSQYTLRNISSWFKSSYDELEMESGDSEAESLSYDTPDSDDNGSTFREMPAAEKSANKIAKSVIGVGSQLAESQMQLTANITSSLKDQTKIIKKGFEKVDKTLQSILEVVTKNTATMIEVTAASASDRSSSESMIERNKFNLGDYKKILKENISNSPLSMLQIPMMKIKSAMDDPKSFFSAKNLLSMGLDFGMDKLAPGLEKSMKEFDKSLNDMIMSSLIRLGQDKSFGFKGILSRIVGINSERKDFNENTRSSLSIKAVPFDSLAHEAITSTIPGYLRKILVALGGEDLIYDYRSRSFRSKGAMQREFRNRSAANGSIGHASKDMKDIFGTDNFGNMMYDLMVSRLGTEYDMNSIIDSFKDEGQLKKFLTDTLSMKDDNGNQQIHLSSKERKRIDQMEKRYREALKSPKGKSIGKNINMSVARSNVNRNRDMESYIEEMDRYGIDVSEFSADAQTDIKAILERNGRLTDAEKKAGRSVIKSGNRSALADSDALEGVDYSNRALYEIWRRLNEGINVFQVGSSNGTEPFQKFSSEYLKPPKNYHAKNISGSDFVASSNNKMIKEMLSDHGPNLLENQEGENLDKGTRVERWIGSRGKQFGKALMSGDAQGIVGAGAGALKDVGGVIGKAINKSFGNITGAIRHKFTGAAYSYQDTDKDGKPITVQVAANEKKGILGFIAGEFNNSLKNIKEKGSNWFKSVSGYFKFDDGKADKEDGGKAANRRNKFIAASVGALAGGGLLGGPIGMLMGGLAGSMISGFDVGGKIKDLLFGRDKDGKGTGILARLSDKVIDPIKYQFQKTAHALGNMVKKNILGPLSDLGQAIKDRITAAAESRFGKVFKFIGKALMAPFKGIGKLLLNIVKLPVNLIGGATRMVAGAGTGLIGNLTEGLAKTIAGKSTAKHTITDPKTGETKEVSSKDYIKYRRNERNKKIKEEDAGFDNFKTWQRNQREARAERRKRYKDATSEDIMIENIDVSKETSENTSTIAENTSNIAESVDTLTRNATEHNGQESIATHDQGIHDLLKEIIKLLTGENDGSAMSTVEHVDDLHEEIPVEKLPDSVGEAKSIIAENKKDDNKEETKNGVKITEDGIFHSNPAVRNHKFTDEEKAAHNVMMSDLADIKGDRKGPLDPFEMLEFVQRQSERDELARLKSIKEKDPNSIYATDEKITKLEDTVNSYSNKDKESSTGEVTSALADIENSEDSTENKAINKNDEKSNASVSIITGTSKETEKKSDNLLNSNRDDEEKAAKTAKEFALSAMPAAVSVGGADGTISPNDARDVGETLNQAASDKPNIGKIKGVFNKLFHRKEENTKQEGEKKQSWFSKLIGGIRNVVGGVFGNVKNVFTELFSGNFGPLLTNIAGIGLILGGAGWLKNKGNGSILEGVGVVAGEVKTWWDENKEGIFDGIKKTGKILGDFWDNIVEPLSEPVGKLLESLVPAIGKLAEATARIIEHFGWGIDGTEDPTTAGANMVASRVDVNMSDISAIAGNPMTTLTHNEKDGAGQEVINQSATTFRDDILQSQFRNVSGQQMMAGMKENYYTAKSNQYLNKAVEYEAAGNNAKAESALAKATKAEEKAQAAAAQGASYSYSKAGAKAIGKMVASQAIGSGAGALVSGVASGLGLDDEQAQTLGNGASMLAGAAMTTSVIKSTIKGTDSILDKVVDGFEKLVNEIAKKIKGKDAFKGINFTDVMFKKCDDFFAKILKKIPGMKKLMEAQGPKWLQKLAAKLGIQSVAGASAAVTLGITVAVGAVNGLLNGICGVEHLFGVLPDKATPLMVTISAGLRTILGALETLPVVGAIVSVLDMLDMIIAGIFGKGLTQLLAEFLINLTPDAVAYQQAREEFESELAYYNETYGSSLDTSTFNDKVNRGGWMDMLWQGKQDYDENGHLRFDEAGGDIHHGMEQLFVGGEKAYYKNADGTVRKNEETGEAIQLQDEYGNVVKKDMKWGDHVGNWFGSVGRFFAGGDKYETDENGYAKLDENGNKIVTEHETGFFEHWMDGAKQIADSWNNFWMNVGGGISQFFQSIPKVFSSIGDSFSSLGAKVGDGDVGQLWASSSTTEDNPLSGFTNIIDCIGKVIYTIPTAIAGVGKKIDEFFSKIRKVINKINEDNGANVAAIWGAVPTGDVNALWSIQTNEPEDTPLTGIYRAFNSITKVIATVPTVFVGVGKSIGEWFSENIAGPLSNIWNIISTDIGSAFGAIGNGDVGSLWAQESSIDDNTPGSGIFKAIHIAAKVIATIPTAVVGVGKAIGEWFKKLGSDITQTAVGLNITNRNVWSKVSTGDVGQLWNVPMADPNSPFGGIANAIVMGTKVIATVPTVFVGVGKSIGEFFANLFAPVPEAFNGAASSFGEMTGNILTGDIEGLWATENKVDSSNPLSGFVGVIQTVGKVIYTIPTALSWVGHKIADFFIGISTSVADGFTIIAENYSGLQQTATEGDVAGLWETEYKEDENNPIGGLMQAIFVIQKVVNTPLAAICWVGKTIGGFFASIGEAVSNDYNKYISAIAQVEKAADDGDVGKVWGVSFEGSSLVTPFFFIGVVFAKLANTVKAVWNGFTGWLGDVGKYLFGDDSAEKAAESAKATQGVGGPSSEEDESTNSTNTVNETIGGNPINRSPAITSHFGPRTDPYTGYHHGIDIVSADGNQDNVEVGSRFNGTVSKIVSNVPNYAKATQGADGVYHYNYSGKYAEGGNQVWINTDDGYTIKNMHLAANSIPSSLKVGSKVNVGDKLGIMGTTGWSTGNHLHYQIEKNGEALDPENNVMNGSTLTSFKSSGSSSYQSDPEVESSNSSNWLSNIINAIKSAGIKALSLLTGGLFGNDEEKEDTSTLNDGSTCLTSYNGELGDEAAEIWNYLKSKGWTDEMVSAVLGCWTCESGVKAKTIEYDYCKSSEYPAEAENGGFPYNAIISSNEAMDKWCQYLFDMYDRCGIPISRDGYKATDGHYYPGIGYAGWTGDNTRQMLEYANEKNMAWDDPKFQLDWMEHQLHDLSYFRHLDTFNKLSKATSPEDAAGIFATDFEGCPKSWQDKRKAAARNIFNQWKGMQVVSVGSALALSDEEKEDLDKWYDDYNDYLTQIVDKHASGNSIARSEYEKAHPNGYTEWKAGREFAAEKSEKLGGIAYNEWMKSDAGKKARQEYIDEYVAKYKMLNAKKDAAKAAAEAENEGKGGPSEGSEEAISSLGTHIVSQITNSISEDSKGGKGGPKNTLSNKVTAPIDFTKETWLGAHKQKIGTGNRKNLGKGGDDSSALYTIPNISSSAKKQSHQPKAASTTNAASYGRGGNPFDDKYTNTNKDQSKTNVSINTTELKQVISIMSSMLIELKSIAGNTNSSSEYLESINNKDFVDQGLRDSINSLGKVTKKTSSTKTSGGSARTVASLARPQ